MAEWAPIAKEHNLQCQRFDGGVELRLPGQTKGSAIRAILEGHRKCDFVVYVGNDQTDVDSLELVQGIGHPMAAGPSLPDSLIINRFPGPEAVGEFLIKWAQIEESIPALPAGAPPPVVKAARPAPPGADAPAGVTAKVPAAAAKEHGAVAKGPADAAAAGAGRNGKGVPSPKKASPRPGKSPRHQKKAAAAPHRKPSAGRTRGAARGGHRHPTKPARSAMARKGSKRR